MAKMTWWLVTLNGKWVDEVSYTADCDAEYVRRSLIDHDGYHPLIEVRRMK